LISQRQGAGREREDGGEAGDDCLGLSAYA
jgi:hypothetical protein